MKSATQKMTKAEKIEKAKADKAFRAEMKREVEVCAYRAVHDDSILPEDCVDHEGNPGGMCFSYLPKGWSSMSFTADEKLVWARWFKAEIVWLCGRDEHGAEPGYYGWDKLNVSVGDAA